MIPSEWAGMAPVSARSASNRLAWTIRPPASAASRARTTPKSLQLGLGLGPVEAARDVGERSAGLDESGRDGERPGRRVRMSERRGVHDDAGHEERREGAVALVERRAESHREQRRHLAGRGGSRVDPVGRATLVVRGVVIEDDARQALEHIGVPLSDGADPIDGPAVGDHEQVVVGVRLRVGAGAVDIRQEVVDRRERIGEDRGRPATDPLDEPADRQRRAERVCVGVLMADGEHVAGRRDAVDDRTRDRLGPR